MSQLVEKSGRVEVPKGAGVEGFVRAMRAILRLPRVQSVHINNKGEMEFVRLARPDEEPQSLSVDFESVMPYSIIRNNQLRELAVPQDNAAVALVSLFRQVTLDRLFPISFVGSPASSVWSWFRASNGMEIPETDELFGFPFLVDTQVENEVLMLCTAPTRSAALIDTSRTYKISMPRSST